MKITDGPSLETTPRLESAKTLEHYFTQVWDVSPDLAQALSADCQQHQVSTEILDLREKPPPNLNEVMKQFVFVHLTDHAPQNNTIYPMSEVNDPSATEYNGRSTIHGCISQAVPSHLFGDWTNSSYAILIPADKITDDLAGFYFKDSFTVGPLTIPEDSIILTDSPPTESSVTTFNLIKIQQNLLEHATIDELTCSLLIDSVFKKNTESLQAVQPNGNITPSEFQSILLSLTTDASMTYLDPVKIKPFLPQTLANSLPDSPIKISKTLESPMHYAVMKSIIEMGRLPISEGRSTYLWDRNNSPDRSIAWESTPLESALQEKFGPQIMDTVWFDIEKIWKSMDKNDFDQLKSPLFLTLESDFRDCQNQQDYYKRIIQLLSYKGRVMQKVLKLPSRNLSQIRRKWYTFLLARKLRNKTRERLVQQSNLPTIGNKP